MTVLTRVIGSHIQGRIEATEGKNIRVMSGGVWQCVTHNAQRVQWIWSAYTLNFVAASDTCSQSTSSNVDCADIYVKKEHHLSRRILEISSTLIHWAHDTIPISLSVQVTADVKYFVLICIVCMRECLLTVTSRKRIGSPWSNTHLANLALCTSCGKYTAFNTRKQ